MEARRSADLRRDGWTKAGIEHAVRSGAAYRVAKGALLLGTGPASLRDRVAALFQVLPPAAVVAFHTAAALYGFGVVPHTEPYILVPAGSAVPDIRKVAIRQAVLPIGEPRWVDGLPCVPPERAAIDLARTCRRLDAIAVLDAALRSGHCQPASLARELARHDRLRGVRQARQLVALADPRAECRQESGLRLVLVDGRLARPEPQLWVHDEWEQPRYRLDLGYQDLLVAAEYDGASHLDRSRMRADRERHNWLAARGWTMRYFTDRDLYQRRPYIVATMREAIARAPRDRRSRR